MNKTVKDEHDLMREKEMVETDNFFRKQRLVRGNGTEYEKRVFC